MPRRLLAALLISALAGACAESAVNPFAARSNASVALSTGLVLVDGPTLFTRGTGAPVTETRTIATAGFQAPFELHIQSGSTTGSNRVTSATVTWDGATILSPSDFNPSHAEWVVPVTAGATGTLTVRITGKPGTYLTIALHGAPAATVFCSTPVAGGYTDLRQAVLNTPVDGTIFVCDGVHDVDTVRIDRPLTIRSQNPQGATLRDSDPAPGFNSGRPALVISGVPAGTVAIRDLTIESRGRGVHAEGAWSHVVVDSSRFIGTVFTTATGVTATTSSVAGARLDVSNSHFEGHMIGVFPTGPFEANVTSSNFERFNAGSITHSGNSTIGVAWGRVEDSRFSACGSLGCIRSFGSQMLVARNVIDLSASTISSQSGFSYIRIDSPFNVVVGPLVAEDNVVIGAPLAGAPAAAASWTVQNAFMHTDAFGFPAIYRRNSVRDAHSGLSIASLGAGSMVTATDNVVQGGYWSFRRAGALGTALIERNDFVGQVGSFQALVAVAGDSFRCNWWGSAAGPTAPPGPAAAYTPWATAAIAGLPTVCP
jgi:hypothetical protein